MSTPQAPANGEITGNVLLYSKPEPLNAQIHGELGLAQTDHPFAFAFAANAVPVQVTEFGPAGINYPIIFAGDERAPLAIMSVRPNENLFITEGRFDADAYVPAFIRRYPFVVANDAQAQQLVVCIDRAADFIRPGGEVKLFENGEPSAYTKNAIQFCTDFETERQRTDAFVATLKELDLFESRTQTFTPRLEDGSAGEPITIADYFAVSEDKLAKLDDAKFKELRDTGALQQIYAHLNSLFGWDKLIARTLSRPPVAANA